MSHTKLVKVEGPRINPFLRFAEDAVANYSWLVNPILQRTAGQLSPFDRYLGFHFVQWEERRCELRLQARRKLSDERFRLHSGVVSATGERAAFFLLLRNFPFWRYSFRLKEVDSVFSEELKGNLFIRVGLDAETFKSLEQSLSQKTSVNLTLKSEVLRVKDLKPVASVRTSWQLKKENLIQSLWNK